MPANYLYPGDDFATDGLLVEESPYETLYRLDEAYWGVRQPEKPEIRETVAWLGNRLEFRPGGIHVKRTEHDRLLTGSYRKPNGEYVRVTYRKLPSGEAGFNDGVMVPALLHRFADGRSKLARQAARSLLEAYPGPKRRPELLRRGVHCCEKSCNIQYQRALARVDRDLYLQQESAFMRSLRRNREGRSRWKVYPFYYTVLCLHDIRTPEAEAELCAVAAKTSRKLMDRYGEDDRAGRVRRKALSVLFEYA